MHFDPNLVIWRAAVGHIATKAMQLGALRHEAVERPLLSEQLVGLCHASMPAFLPPSVGYLHAFFHFWL
ncbi:hypothetical protein IE4803_CH02983 [Rhizobium etli bv. phaseoli str. IE4803]|nr:hypothetical protein IE4803_CH02983 [Rhizobium etli bv. phaseoli str. IE4803]